MMIASTATNEEINNSLINSSLNYCRFRLFGRPWLEPEALLPPARVGPGSRSLVQIPIR
jgi:hypothetical protein